MNIRGVRAYDAFDLAVLTCWHRETVGGAFKLGTNIKRRS